MPQEEADWHALLQKVEALDQQALAGQQHQEAGAAAGCAAASDAAAAAAAAGGEAAAPTAEEAGLSSVATEPGSYGATPAAATPADDGELAALAAATAGVHRRLAMQVGRWGVKAGSCTVWRCSAPRDLEYKCVTGCGCGG